MKDIFIEYIIDNLEYCVDVLLFCFPNALDSLSIKKQWTAIDALNKSIIPIFTKSEHIPSLLSSRLGLEVDQFDMRKST